MNNSEINMVCPSCGAVVNFELTRCPECGLDFYPEEQLEEEKEHHSNSSFLFIAGSVLLGVFISAIIAFIFHFIAAQFFTGVNISWLGLILIFIAGPCGALAGGYISSGLSGWKPYLSAVLVSAFTIPIVILLNTRWMTAIISMNSILNWGCVILAGPAGAYLQNRLKQGIQWPGSNASKESKLYQDLLVRSRFDRDRADRLIAYEQRRNPMGSRAEAIKSAIERWERDNR